MTLPPNDRSVYCFNITVGATDIDDLDHVNNVVYVGWVQDAAGAHWKMAAPEALRSQCRWVVLRHEIDYIASAVLGEKLNVFTWVDAPSGALQTRHVSIQRVADHKVLAYAQSTWALLDPTTSRPKRISEEIVNTFLLEKGE